ncbi:MAG: rhomboid family intramembrane serine protease [Abditibacteriales bacterium]|nr:rhomboid family intramembrane serine protease [Abditibacteriales bacterium]MDW8364943.1 rhomboid family intramembrane serine protease [Abditibacteriales bacterium]
MLPLRDNIPSRRYPFVNIALIWTNFLAFAYQLSLGDRLDDFLRLTGVVPAHFTQGTSPLGWYPLLTSLFLHGGWMHLLGNMLFLWIFGDNVEDRLGHLRYLFFYLVCGVGASIVHIFFNLNSTVPAIGASGAISGVLAGYLMLYPTARVATLVIFFFLIDIVELPALLFIGIWFLQQFFAGVAMLPFADAAVGGVAYWAHIGGFVVGFVCVRFFCIKRPARRRFADEWYPF